MEKGYYYSKVRKILLTSMILVPGIPFILTLAIGYYYFTNSLATSTISSMERIIEDHRQMIESFLRERKRNLEFICDSYTFQHLSRPEKLHTVFRNLKNESTAFADLGVFNEEGLHVAYHGSYKLTGKIYKNSAWFKEVIKSGYYISDVFLGFRKIPHFIIAIAGEQEGKKWVIRATIDTLMFSDLVKKVRIGKTGEAYILNSDRVLQTERRSGGCLMDKLREGIKLPEDQNSISTFVDKRPTGEKYLYSTAWLKNKKWLLVVRQEKADAFKALYTASYMIILITIIGGAVIIGVAFYMTGRIVKRLEKMDTEKDQLSQQLIGASRLAEIGEMSTGFAHEINNPLQIIKSEQALIELLMSELKESGDLKESESLTEMEDSMEQIKLQITRCAKITQAILKFGRQTEPLPKDIDLKDFIPEVMGMVAKKAAVSGISLKQEISGEISQIHGDPSQLQQVLINLFNNAMDAVVERHGASGGKISVLTGPLENNTVEIKVTDNGSGINPENLKKVFSPFFTTKPVGKGTGLGLSVCYGIIDHMGGTMTVGSEKGVGTTFAIRLPAVK